MPATLKTPILRLRGDQGGEAAARRGFEEEAKDFGGDFVSIALAGTAHGDFATPWMNGQPTNFGPNAHAEPAPERTATLAALLADFFETYLLRKREGMALIAASRPEMHAFLRHRHFDEESPA